MTNRPMYTVKFASAVRSDVRKLDKQLQRIIKEEHFANIERDPFEAAPLLYEFKGLWSYHFNYKCHCEEQSDEAISHHLVIMIGSSERLYEALRRRVK